VADMGNCFPGFVYFAGEFQDVGITLEFVGGELVGYDKQVKVRVLLTRDGSNGFEWISVFAGVNIEEAGFH